MATMPENIWRGVGGGGGEGKQYEPVTCDFQQFDILISVDLDEPVQSPLSLETPNGVQSVA